MSVRTALVPLPDGSQRYQSSVVHIHKCRFLEQTACANICNHVCKIPTQTFFKEKWGLPLYMRPDFDTLSCDMVFGQEPPPVHEDPAMAQSCLKLCAPPATVQCLGNRSCLTHPHRRQGGQCREQGSKRTLLAGWDCCSTRQHRRQAQCTARLMRAFALSARDSNQPLHAERVRLRSQARGCASTQQTRRTLPCQSARRCRPRPCPVRCA